MIECFSLSSGRTSSFMGLEFGKESDDFVFALVEADVYNYHNVHADKQTLSAFNWIRQQQPQFWASAEDDRSLICMHKLSKEISEKITFGRDIKIVTAHQYASKERNFDVIANKYLPNARKRLCTQELKVIPIFNYYTTGIRAQSEPVKMHIGFRLDEVERTVNLYFRVTPIKNRVPNPDFDLTQFVDKYQIPSYIITWWERLEVEDMVRRGVYLPKEQPFNVTNGVYWRVPSFPLIEHKITKTEIVKYWQAKPQYPFPEISNCVGCFHHTFAELKKQFRQNKNKMEWFCRQEDRTKRTFSSGVSYRQISEMPEQLEFTLLGGSCDSGGCTD